MENSKKLEGVVGGTNDVVKNQFQETAVEVKIAEGLSFNSNHYQNELKTIKELLKEAEIDPFSVIEKPPTILSVDDISFGTLGNFSCITGKPKSKKTFFLSMLIAAALDVDGQFQRIKTEIANTTILHFDTEQSRYHTQKVSKRIIILIGNNQISEKYYKCYCLRPFSPKERTEIIKEAIYNTKGVKLVIIDGIADLIIGYNNEESAINIVNDLMKWTAELNIHIITILHQNKGDNNAKGHLGSIILQKAETVLSVDKDGDISNVTPSHSRDRDIAPISFSVNKDGLPYFVDFTTNSNNNDSKIRHPRDVDKDVHITILNEVFNGKTELLSTDFQRFLKDILAKHSINIGNAAIRDWKTFYERANMIIKENQQSPFKLSANIRVG
ncbi:AAA family ATPase [Polaribacter glomeratus]|uniref:Mobilization protein n=1 Tax=Polaribacter glomeratus TaxID=102 RepID=A0A2S7WIT0_9FLAO|nr:AAA family ATPase [Polaribacter glomeratus]PQJ77515.1 hypothetical protein BTO16_16995 [Polaribacter glomeratus]TXD66107.1 AAA family ATPase [Polaribacter glomeratus]